MNSLKIQNVTPMFTTTPNNVIFRSVSLKSPAISYRKKFSGQIQCNSTASEQWIPVADPIDGEYKWKHVRVSKMPNGTVYLDTMLSNSVDMPETPPCRRQAQSTPIEILVNQLKRYGLQKLIEIPIEIIVKFTLRSLARKYVVARIVVDFLDNLDKSDGGDGGGDDDGRGSPPVSGRSNGGTF